jgi:major membrane immunogen (membrane-anchored lipoprotein)
MIESIKACNYDKKTKDGKPAEDVAEFEGDDPYDDLRYACDSAERYFEEAGEEFKKVQREAAVLAQLNATQDWTAFYRNMRTIEAGSQQRMISRYHHSRARRR